ncbi:MAG: KH domain-containing protein, partial [Candidatus Aenigmatarchaeota archaeon]
MEPVCEVCIEEGTLCNSCREGLEVDMEEDALEVSEFLESLKEEHSYLEDVEVKRIYTCGKVLVIVAPAEDVGKVVGRGGEIVKKLADEWDRSIRVVEYSEDPKKFARDLLPNVNIY